MAAAQNPEGAPGIVSLPAAVTRIELIGVGALPVAYPLIHRLTPD
jgi:hypothetical protein